MNGPYDPGDGEGGSDTRRGAFWSNEYANAGRVDSLSVLFADSTRLGSTSPTSVAALYEPRRQNPHHRHGDPASHVDLERKLPALPGAFSGGGTKANHRTHVPYEGVSSNKMHSYQSSSPTTTEARNSPIMVEIAPGVRVRLRGAKETRAAIARDFYIPAVCFACSLDILCIMDANYVVCPACRVISPLTEGADLDYNGGVGLGFTWEDLQEWQAQLLQKGSPPVSPEFHTNNNNNNNYGW